MIQIAYIPADKITRDCALFIDAMVGYIRSVRYNGEYDEVTIEWEDSNGNHLGTWDADHELPIVANW